MKKRRPLKKNSSSSRISVRLGVPRTSSEDASGVTTDPRLPHEHDQSTDATNPKPDPMMEQAHRDIESGQVDTDLHTTPGLDAEHRQRLLRKPRKDAD